MDNLAQTDASIVAHAHGEHAVKSQSTMEMHQRASKRQPEDLPTQQLESLCAPMVNVPDYTWWDVFTQPALTVFLVYRSIVADLTWLYRAVRPHATLAGWTTLLAALAYLSSFVEGQHQAYVLSLGSTVSLASWWIGLGILSSVGLGTGLHTFLLFLGPFIAQVTIAATECNSLDFARYGPDRFVCVSEGTSSLDPSLMSIASLVWFEAFCWGAGTAIGELPPYFIARQARLAGMKLEELNEAVEGDNSLMSTLTGFVEKYLGTFLSEKPAWQQALMICLFASIPNPLFDLAGLTCGHVLVPFTIFFFPTLVGKAVNKVGMQVIFIITIFHKSNLARVVSFIETYIPVVESGSLQHRFDSVRTTFHRMPGEEVAVKEKGIMGQAWDIFLALMISYFLLTIFISKVRDQYRIYATQNLPHAKRGDIEVYNAETPRRSKRIESRRQKAEKQS